MKKKNSNLNSKNKMNGEAKAHDDMSLGLLLHTYGESDAVPFHMPGHKRKKDYAHLSGMQSLDITEIDGFDNLHNASGVLKDAQKRAAEFFGVKESRFLTCGSTAGVLAAVRTLTYRGDEVIVARNCHRSVFNAVELCSLVPHYVAPTYFEEYGFYGSVMPEDVEASLEAYPRTTLVIITSPTYEGVISDIKSIAKICHQHGARLLVDEAHGAHLGLSRKFEQSARALGADIVINSLHKTLPSLTQTAILHVCSDRVNMVRLDENLAIFQTSSPSYVLMASIDGCIKYLSEEGARELDDWSNYLDKFRKSMSSCHLIKLFKGAGEGGRVFAYDKSKLVFLTVESALGGIELMRSLRNKYKIELEMASANYALAMTGAGDELKSYLALSQAVYEIDCNVRERYGLVNINIPQIPNKAFNPYEIEGLSCDFVDLDVASGCVSAETIWAYPPGNPLITKGEVIDQNFIRHALFLYECGISIESEYKKFPDEILVVGENADKA